MLTKEFLDLSTRLMFGKEHPRVDVNDLLDIVVPNPPIEVQETIVNYMKENVEKKVDSIKSKIIPLQSVIDSVFKCQKVRNDKKTKDFAVYQSRFEWIGEQKYLRCGANYRFFWDIQKGLLFNSSNYQFERLGNLVEVYNPKILKKGDLESDCILVDLPYILPREGRIKNEAEIVNKIGSDKFLFGDSDLLYSQIDPFLGHVILNDKSRPLIGTPELIPLKVKTKTDARFIRYLLLSQEFLNSSKYLMYGKRHPRIHSIDMLNLKVPHPDFPTQQKISEQIWQIEKSNIEFNETINALYNKVTDILLRHLTAT